MPTLHNDDAIKVMSEMKENSINLIATDPPYYKVKNEPWDNQWDTAEGFLSWVDELCRHWARILAPNGSLYVFASPQMAWHVEGVIRKYFNVLNHISWKKTGGTRANQADKEILRQFFGNSERIIFAEHYNSDNIAKGEAGYLAKCDELRGFVFEPLREYLDGERKKAGLQDKPARRKMGLSIKGGGLLCHFWNKAQWMLPTAEQYTKLQQAFPGYFTREYEDLRREYEDLRRPFNATADAPYTDVWTFPTVSNYSGKHPCEKPVEMMEHIVKMSSRVNDVVLDCFMGSGNTGVAAAKHGREFIGIDASENYFNRAKRRVFAAYKKWDELGELGKPEVSSLEGLPLFTASNKSMHSTSGMVGDKAAHHTTCE